MIFLFKKATKKKWDSLGVKWVGSLEGNPFLVRAELPFGWNVREGACPDFDMRSFTVLDGKSVPKAKVYMKLAFYDRYADVTVLSDEEAAERKAQFAPKDGQKEFDSLLAVYNESVKTTAGTGERGQTVIDGAYAPLEVFVASHPQFCSDLPTKHFCYDDGHGGMAGAMMTLAANSDECVLM